MFLGSLKKKKNFSDHIGSSVCGLKQAAESNHMDRILYIKLHIVSQHVSVPRLVLPCVYLLSPGEKSVLTRGRSVSVVRVALLAAKRRPALDVSFVGGRDVDVTFAQPLARAQAGAGLPEQSRAILRGRRRARNMPAESGTYRARCFRKLHTGADAFSPGGEPKCGREKKKTACASTTFRFEGDLNCKQEDNKRKECCRKKGDIIPHRKTLNYKGLLEANSHLPRMLNSSSNDQTKEVPILSTA